MVQRVLVFFSVLAIAAGAYAQSPIEGVLQEIAGNEAQRELGRLVENICPTGQLEEALQARCNEIVGNAFEGNLDGVRHSLQALAPEENLVVASSFVDPSIGQVEVVQQRLATIRSGASGSASFALNFNDGLGDAWAREGTGGYLANRPAARLGALASPSLQGDATADDVISVEGRWGFFANGTASSIDRDATSRTSGFEADLKGLTAGVDYRVSSHFVVGGAIGWEESDSNIDLDGGGIDNETTTFSLQASWFGNRSSWFEAIVGFGQTDIDQARAIRYTLPGVLVDSVATGTTSSDQQFASIATGWDLAASSWAFSPEIRVDYQSSDVDAFSESVTGVNANAAGLGIAYAAQDFTSLTAELGVQIGYNASTSFGVVIPQLNAAYIQEFEDGGDQVHGSFLADTQGESYTLLTDETDDGYARIGVGAVFVFRGGKSFYAFYDQLVAHDYLDVSTFSVGLRLGL